MYSAHDTFRQPDDLDAKVWRYMDFTKLVALLESESLYFTRADKFDDPFEGSWPKFNVKARFEVPPDLPANAREPFLKSMSDLGRINRNWPRYVAANCWHMNSVESAAMWKLYLKSDEGVAVQSTYSRLRDSLIDERPVHLGQVSYIDYERDAINDSNVLAAFMHKRKSFSHESEVRAVLLQLPVGPKGIDFSQETIGAGLEVKIDLNKLVERIYIAPSSPAWIAELVNAVLARFGREFEVVQSDLKGSPVY